MRNEKGLLVYDREEFRSLCTERENALNDEYMEKFRLLFSKYDRGEISKDEYEHLAEELDDEHTAACEKLYDEEFGGFHYAQRERSSGLRQRRISQSLHGKRKRA